MVGRGVPGFFEVRMRPAPWRGAFAFRVSQRSLKQSLKQPLRDLLHMMSEHDAGHWTPGVRMLGQQRGERDDVSRSADDVPSSGLIRR